MDSAVDESPGAHTKKKCNNNNKNKSNMTNQNIQPFYR